MLTLRMALVAAAVLLGACGGSDPAAPNAPVVPDTPRVPATSAAAAAYLDTALLFTEQSFYYGSRVNWAALRSRAVARSAGAQTTAGTHAAIDTAVRELNDRHSFFYRPAETLGNREDPSGPLYTPVSTTIAPRIGYLWLTSFGGRNGTARADTLRRLIQQVDSASDVCGWIIDQRANTGGFWPVMLSGISPLITNGSVGGFVERDPTERYSYFVQDGNAGLVDPSGRRFVYQTAAQSYQLRRPNPPVALLQGQFTASAGEIVVMAFKEPARGVRTFGAPTYGVTSQPYTYRMRDTASIQVTAAIMFDRQGRDYAGGAIAPDEAVAGPAVNSAFQPAVRDAVVDAAVSWLNTRPECTGTVAARSPAPPAGALRPARIPLDARPASEWPRGRPTPWTAGAPGRASVER
jgi:C-terminal processing protease CtpA/Prc